MALRSVRLPPSESEARRAAKEAELNANLANGQNGHGGARDGAGRKPKALRYANELAEAENKIIAALPDVIDSLIRSAKGGDVSAARYLLDRVFGRIKAQSAPPADDQSLPYSEEDAESAMRHKEKMKSFLDVMNAPF